MYKNNSRRPSSPLPKWFKEEYKFESFVTNSINKQLWKYKLLESYSKEKSKIDIVKTIIQNLINSLEAQGYWEFLETKDLHIYISWYFSFKILYAFLASSFDLNIP